MRLGGLIFSIIFMALMYLSFIDNISINIGDEDIYISEKEWFEESIEAGNKMGIPAKNERNLLDVFDFEKYLLSMKNAPFRQHRITHMDTTGDGQNEEVHRVVHLENNGCTISNYILKDGRVIWEDKALIDEEVALSLTANSDFVHTYGPYALFYLGISQSTFMDDLRKDGDFDERKKQILRSMNEGQELNVLYNSQLSRDIDNYQGKYLFKMSDGLKHIYMWDKDSENFKCIYQSNTIIS